MSLHDRIYLEKGEIEKVYDQVDLIKGEQRKDQFILAMAIGYQKNHRVPLKVKQTLFLTKYLKPEDEALINAVALEETGDVNILANKGEVYKIAEEYANAGIHFLKNEEHSHQLGSYSKFFEKKVLDLYEKLDETMPGD